jgi:hypothetical protein
MASCDPRCAPDFLRLLQLKGFPAGAAEIGRGMDNRLEHGRIRGSARSLSTAQDFVASRGEFVDPGECELPVGHIPTAISQLFAYRARGARFENLQPVDCRSELVRYGGDVRRVGVEGVCFAFSSRTGRPGAKQAAVANGFGLKADRIVRVTALGDREALPDVVVPAGFVSAATEGRISSRTDAVAFALDAALCAAVGPLATSTVPLVTGFDGGRSSYLAACAEGSRPRRDRRSVLLRRGRRLHAQPYCRSRALLWLNETGSLPASAFCSSRTTGGVPPSPDMPRC